MKLDEAKRILTDKGYLVEDTSIYSALSDFYRYLMAKAPKTGYDFEIQGDENSITVKFKNNVAKVTLEQFDEDADPMLYVEAGNDFKAFYNEHADYGNALQFIIKNICQTNEAIEILRNNDYLVEDTDVLSRYESKFTVGTGRFASDKVIQWSQYHAGAIEKNAVFYPKEIVDKLIKTYQTDIESLKEQIKELEHELNSMDLER